jgi:tetratricopeptide (TPR) repeat protein
LRNLAPGSAVPRLSLPALSGGEADVLGEDGQITVILFWGTDSEGKIERSVELLQTLQTIGESYGDQGVVVRSVNIDKNNRAALEKLVKEAGTAVPVLLDEHEELYGTYGLYIFPTVAIVDRDGTLKDAVGYTRRISADITGQIEIMLGLKTEEELYKELNPEEIVELPEHVMKANRRVRLGRQFMEKRLYDMAGAEFERAVGLDPQNAEAHAELGAFLVRKGEYDKALSELGTAIDLDPESVTAHFALGVLHHGKKDFEKAIEELEDVLSMDSGNTRAMGELGAVYEDMGQIDKALEYYRTALETTFKN